MDETEGTTKDTLQETGQTSGGEAGTTSGGEPKTYTAEQIRKIDSDARAEAGREAKAAKTEATKAKASLSEAESQLSETKQQISDLEKRIDDAELEGARDDPERVKLYQQRQELRVKESALEEGKRKLAKDKLEHEAEIKVARESQGEIAIWQTAIKYGVDPVKLKELNLTSPEQIEAVAKAIAAQKTAASPPGGEGSAALLPDSGVTSGGEGTPTVEQLEKMTPTQYAAWRKKGSK